MKRGVLMSLAATLALAGGASAQSQLWVVDDDPTPSAPADFTDLPPALAAAANGDVVYVRDGRYSPFALSAKGLTIVGEAGASVVVVGACSVAALTPAQTFVLRGVDISSGIPDLTGELVLSANAGTVWVEELVLGTVFQIAPNQGIRASSCASVVLIGSTVYGGVNATGSNVYAFESNLFGTTGAGGSWPASGCVGPTPPATGAGGFVVTGGYAFVSGGAILGGKGGGGSFSTSCGCQNGGSGGVGLVLSSGAVFDTVGTSILGGPGGIPGPFGTCTSGPAGLPITSSSGTVNALPDVPRRFGASAHTVEGQAVQLTFGAPAGDSVFVFFGAGTIPTSFPPWSGIVLPSLPGAFVPVGTIPASGSLVVNVPIAELGAGVEAVVLYAQGIFADVVAGGVRGHLGPGSCVVLLDSPGP